MTDDQEYRYLIECAGEPRWFTVKKWEGVYNAKGWGAFLILDGDTWKKGAISEKSVILWHER